MNPNIDLLADSLVRVQAKLEGRGIASALLGGMALAVWARPRMTKDVDLKVLVTRDQAEELISALGNGYRPLHHNPLEALRRQGLLFVLDPTGTRIDLLLADTSFDRAAIQRAQNIEIRKGLWAKVVTPEDLIIYKMISTRRQDQLDVEQVIRLQGARLDDGYVLQWLKQFEEALDDSTLVSAYREMRK